MLGGVGAIDAAVEVPGRLASVTRVVSSMILAACRSCENHL